MRYQVFGFIVASLLIFLVFTLVCLRTQTEAVAMEKESAEKAMTDAMAEGEALFEKNCAVCHPDGGNIINSKKTLSKKDLDANNIKTAEDIVKNMRNPGPGMTKFKEDRISNEDAFKIAEYILKTFE